LSHAAYLVFEASDPMPQSYLARFSGKYSQYAYNSENITRLLQMMKDADAILDATLYVFTYDSARKRSDEGTKDAALLLPWIYNVTRLAHQMGIRVCSGTDDIGDISKPVPNVHIELQLLVEQSGFTPLEAITADKNCVRSPQHSGVLWNC